MTKKGFTLIEFLVGITMTALIFIVATNLVVSFLTVDTKSKRSQEVEQAKSDISSELTNALQWGKQISFTDGTLKVDENEYKVVNGRFLKNNTPFVGSQIVIPRFDVKRFTATTTTPDPQTGTGLMALYFDNKDLTNLKISQTDLQIDFDWGPGSPSKSIAPDSYSARWSGQLEIPETGNYTFYTRSDDGVRLWIGNNLVIDNWTNHSATENFGVLSLTKNTLVDIQLEYYENTNNSVIRLSWAGPGRSKQVIPTEFLYPVQPQTSLQVQVDLEHKDAASIKDSLVMFISPRFADIQSILPLPTPSPTASARPSTPPSTTPTASASPTASATPTAVPGTPKPPTVKPSPTPKPTPTPKPGR